MPGLDIEFWNNLIARLTRCLAVDLVLDFELLVANLISYVLELGLSECQPQTPGYQFFVQQ